MSLPNDEVLQLLDEEFVLGNSNIEREEHVGLSHGYKPSQTAVGTTNGAGGRNVQIMVLAADGTVIHVLPGYWHADDLVDELGFALRLFRLYGDGSRTREQKVAMYEAMHKAYVRRIPAATRHRSSWQPFDASYEVQRGKDEVRDTFALDAEGDRIPEQHGRFRMKPLCDLVHERMIARPFLPFDDFDIEELVDYGRPYYDNNMGHDKGRDFKKAVAANKKREREEARQKAELAKITPHSR